MQIEWDDWRTMDRIARDRHDGRIASVVVDGEIMPDPTYDAWREEYRRRQAVAAAAWWRGECCGDPDQRNAAGWCALAGYGCHACEAGRHLAEMVWK